jgi:hypothetical protein
VIVIVRLTGRNRFSETAERRAQKSVAGSFFVLVPYVLYASTAKLISGSEPDRRWLVIVVLGSSVVLMPVLGWQSTVSASVSGRTRPREREHRTCYARSRA